MLSSVRLMRYHFSFYFWPTGPPPAAGLPHLPVLSQVVGSHLGLFFQLHSHPQHHTGQLPTLDRAVVEPTREGVPPQLVLRIGIRWESLLSPSAYHFQYENKQVPWAHLWKGVLERGEDFLLDLVQFKDGDKPRHRDEHQLLGGMSMDHDWKYKGISFHSMWVKTVLRADSSVRRCDNAIVIIAISWDVLRDIKKESRRLSNGDQFLRGLTALAERMQILKRITSTSLGSQTAIKRNTFLFSVPRSRLLELWE